MSRPSVPGLFFLFSFLVTIPTIYAGNLDFENARREYRSGSQATALRLFREIIEADQAFVAEAHWYMARISVDLGDVEQAFRHFERAIERQDFAVPDDRIRAMHDLARLYYQEQQFFRYEETMTRLFAYDQEFTGDASPSRRANIEQVFMRQSLARALELYRLRPGPFAAAHYEFGMHLLQNGRDDSLQHLLFYLLDTYSIAIEHVRRVEPRYRFIDLFHFTRDIRHTREVNAFLEQRNAYAAIASLGDTMYFHGGGGIAPRRARELWFFVSQQTVAGDAAEHARRQLEREQPLNPGPGMQ